MADNDRDTFEDAFNLLCGDRIGYGMSRQVFECALLPGYVVKVEKDPMHTWQNIMEWKTWGIVESTSASRWFAECRWISPGGRILIQERTRPAGLADFPDRVPLWFTDLKRQNWGMAKSQRKDGAAGKEWLVCHDYGTCLALQDGTSTKRMKKAEWYDA